MRKIFNYRKTQTMQHMSLAKSFVRAITGTGNDGFHVPVSEIRNALSMGSDRYAEADITDDFMLLYCLGIGGLYHGYMAKPAIAVYSDPDKKLPFWEQNPPPDENGTAFPPDRQLATSAAIIASEYRLPFGRTALIAMVRSELVGQSVLYRDTVVFGLYGTYDTYGNGKNFKFKKILVPAIDEYGCMNGLREVDLSNPKEIGTALTYLKSCKDRIFDGSPLFARDNWKQISKNGSAPAPRVP